MENMADFGIRDEENRGHEFRAKQKKLPQRLKRAVLGLMNKNANRVPPQKSKQETSSQNECAKQEATSSLMVQKETFEIYDEELIEEKAFVLKDSNPQTLDLNKRQLDLPPSVTCLHRPPLQDINVEHDLFEEEITDSSPMYLDNSGIISTQVIKQQKLMTAQALLMNVVEYREDIYMYLRETEARHRPKAGYMGRQPDISCSMRSVLVDWLVEVSEGYRLQTETLYLAVSYIDRFLSSMAIVRDRLQLVGTTAMFIAAKYEEIYPPDVGEFVDSTDDTYTKKEVLRMEHLILKVLKFDLSVPTALSFITIFSIRMTFQISQCSLPWYLSELSLLESDPYLQYLPSVMAASCIALARHTLKQEAWTEDLEQSTKYKFEDLKSCISHLIRTFSNANASPQKAIREKYMDKRWQSVSMLTPRRPALV